MIKYITVSLVLLRVVISQAQWQPDVRLTNDPASSSTSFNNAWCVASGGSFVHVVWYDDRDGNNEIYYKRSTDDGLNWQADIRLTNDNATSELPSIAVLGSLVCVVWTDFRDGNNEIYFKRSTDGGINWEADTPLTIDFALSNYPSVSISASVVNVVWMERRDGNLEIYYKRSTDEGISWSTDTRLTNNSSDSYGPSISSASSNVNVVWYDYRDGNAEIYYKRSSDAGMSWGTDTRLTNIPGSSIAASIGVSASDIHVVWQDNRDGEHKIFYMRSTDEGINWEQDTCLTYNSDSSFLPSVAVSGFVVHIVWAHEFPLNREIYYIRSTDAGSSWGQEVQLTNAPEEGWLPSVSISDSILHVVWRDERDGNREIYYKRNTNANVTGIENVITTLPSEFTLEQNYPNPFNPTTKINYQIPELSFVSLKIYDLLGSEIVRLVSEEKSVGSYEVGFDAANLPSGVYFYRLQAGSFVETKKMLLLK